MMPSLLVIADDPFAVRSNRFALRHTAGFSVVATIDGRGSARAALRRLRPDVVLVNDMCQRTNLLARIREARGELPDGTVVLVSGRMDATSFDDAFAAGADAVVSRSVQPAAFGVLLEAIVRGHVAHAPRARRGGQLRATAGQDEPAARTSA